jgi:meso-butanediol dehydrogenase / (S,S)-butanediol dehydrogenase / diacetyl reductase
VRLEHHVALITGGGSGIGRATGLRFAQEGASIAIFDRHASAAERVAAEITAAGGRAIACTGDVTNLAEQERAVTDTHNQLGPVSVLVANAAISEGDDPLAIDEATWDRTVNIVLKGVFFSARAVLPGMLEAGRGAIVTVSSVNAQTGIGEEPYSAAKAGVINLTKNLATRYGPSGIRANCIAPGTVQTPIWNARVERDPEVFERIGRWYPLGRVGQPEDVANAVLFLASDEAAWITGTVLNVDGGLMAGIPRFGSELTDDSGQQA